MSNLDKEYMQRAIDLAKKGAGWTSPNPMVGAVVVKDGMIVAEGYHERYGEYHAERNALTRCEEDVTGATMYVTLEPCCHYGKTPPCTEIIIERGIGKVVIGSSDPNPLVAGKGAQILRDHGIEVVENFMKEECDALNPVFFHYITTKMPYVSMKYAMTLDGKIATFTGDSKWITGDEARNHVHVLRHNHRAIMVGIGTVLADDPMLTCRIDGGRDPVRIICDSSLRIPFESQIVKSAKDVETIVACAKLEPKMEAKKQKLESFGVKVLECPNEDVDESVVRDIRDDKQAEFIRVNLKYLMRWLGENRIDSVFVEGGGSLHYSMLEQGLVNHVYAYIAPKIFGGADAKSPVEGQGVETPSEAYRLANRNVSVFGRDILVEYDVING